MAALKQAKVLARKVEYHTPAEMMAQARQTIARDAEIEVTPIGVKITSKKSKRTVIVPWGNIKACELAPEVAQPESEG